MASQAGLRYPSHIPRDEPVRTVLNVNERPETIPLDLENPVAMGKRLASATERHGLEMRKGTDGTFYQDMAASLLRSYFVAPDVGATIPRLLLRGGY
jgi:hypothetical protein